MTTFYPVRLIGLQMNFRPIAAPRIDDLKRTRNVRLRAARSGDG
jgi:hypothetical protein